MKFFIDNNLSPALAQALHALSANSGHAVVHLNQIFAHNTPDETWIRTLATEGEWAVVTQDQLKKGDQREELRQAGLIIFFLDKIWAHHDFWDTAQPGALVAEDHRSVRGLTG
ncbi:DUF5615 family PIN-like protein [Cupriavidus necator]